MFLAVIYQIDQSFQLPKLSAIWYVTSELEFLLL